MTPKDTLTVIHRSCVVMALGPSEAVRSWALMATQ